MLLLVMGQRSNIALFSNACFSTFFSHSILKDQIKNAHTFIKWYHKDVVIALHLTRLTQKKFLSYKKVLENVF